MSITELMSRLDEVHTRRGDIEVRVFNGAGDSVSVEKLFERGPYSIERGSPDCYVLLSGDEE